MKMQDLTALFSRFNEDDMWGDLIDEASELYPDKGTVYKLRIVGPVHKAQRCFISANNSIVRKMDSSDLRKVLSGRMVDINRAQYPGKCIAEIESASCKVKWSKCLISTVVLLYSSKPQANLNRLHYFPIPHAAVAQLIGKSKEKKHICLSGVKARDITVMREMTSFGTMALSISDTESILAKPALNNLIAEGLRDAKDYYTTLNQKNLLKKSGFFYSFVSENENSALDKHFEPIKQIKNYIEEDQQVDLIENDANLLAEYEGVQLVDFVDVL